MERAMSVDIPPGGTRGAKAPPRGAVGRMLMGVARRVHRLTGSKMSGRPLLYLTTVGAKSGQPRTAVVMPFPEGDGAWLIVASANGAARHPAWLHNLAAHPDRVEIELEGRKTAVTPQTLSGEERATAWERITRERPSFAEYELKTDRDIPVVRLVARCTLLHGTPQR
jgi:deazaflavin-dependent oxidoreductase (nitroreductase family)